MSIRRWPLITQYISRAVTSWRLWRVRSFRHWCRSQNYQFLETYFCWCHDSAVYYLRFIAQHSCRREHACDFIPIALPARWRSAIDASLQRAWEQTTGWPQAAARRAALTRQPIPSLYHLHFSAIWVGLDMLRNGGLTAAAPGTRIRKKFCSVAGDAAIADSLSPYDILKLLQWVMTCTSYSRRLVTTLVYGQAKRRGCFHGWA